MGFTLERSSARSPVPTGGPRPAAGSIELDGQRINSLPADERGVAVVAVRLNFRAAQFSRCASLYL